MILPTILGAMVIALIIGMLLGRYALPVGLFLLTLGIGPMAVLYVYEVYIYTKGDTSSYGMLATICLILLTPPAIVMVVVGVLKRD